MPELDLIVSKEAIESVKLANTEINKLDDSVFKLLGSVKEFNTSFGGANASINNLKSAQEKATKIANEYNNVQKQHTKTTQSLTKEFDKLQIAGAKRAAAMDEENRAYKKLTSEVNTLLRKYQDLAASQGMNTKATKEAKLEYDRMHTKLTDIDRSSGRYTDNVGRYSSMWNGVKSAAIGVGAALGITGGVIKGVEAVINSTDASADSFKRTMSGLREQAGYFARAIATMDFSNFIEGMVAARKEGERYYDQLDLIGNLQRGLGLQKQDIEADITRQRIIAKNKSLDIATREAAVKEILRLEQLKLDKASELGKKEVDNELTNAAATAKIRQLYKGEIADFVTNYDQNLSQIERGKKLLADVKAQTTTTTQIDQYGTTRTTTDFNKQIVLKSRMNEEDRKAVRFAELENVLTDEKRDKIAAALSVQKSATQEQLSSKESLTRIENGLRKELLATERASTKAVEKQRDKYQLLTDSVQELESAMMAMKIAGQQPSQDMIHELISKKAQIAEVKKEVEGLALGMMAVAGKGTKGINVKGSDSRFAVSTKGTGQGAASAPDQFNNSVFDSKGDAQKFAIEGAQVLADTTFTILANADQAQLDLKLSNLEKEKEARLKNFKGTEAERAKIEAEYAKKETKIKTESAKKQKAASIIQATLNMALAIASANTLIPPANIPAMIAAGIAGAAQIAIIAATKIPAYAGGTLSSAPDFVVGDAGPEFMRKPRSGWELVTAPMLELNSPGTQIISAKETRRMMELGQHPGGGVDPTPAIAAMHKDIVSTIRGKREVHISASGRKVTEVEGNSTKSWANAKINWMSKN